MKKVLLFGTFDILHPGHLFLFEEAKKLGDNLVVVIARDKTVAEVKHIKLTNNEDDRLKNVFDLDIADKVTLGNEDDKYEIIREDRPDIIALGYDQKVFTDDLSKVFPKIKIVRLPSFKPEIFKSSKLRKK